MITGITGQDGTYLAAYLLDLDYEVYGVIARCSTPTTWRLEYLNILDKVKLMEGDLTDAASLMRILLACKPDEVYNLGAQSFVATSWNQPLLTAETTGLGAVNMLEGIRQISPEAKFYIDPSRFRQPVNPALYASAERLKDEFNWENQTSLSDGLLKTLNYWRKNTAAK